MARRLRIGILGLGRIFDLHCLGYRHNAFTEVIGLCDLRNDLLRQRGLLFPAARLVHTLDELLSLECDLIEILAPHSLHADMTVAALQAGSHVSVQKPMALALSEADRMIEITRHTNRHLRVFENFLFYPPLVKAKELLDAGVIGRPLHFRMKIVSGDPELAWQVPSETTRWRDELNRRGLGGPIVFDHGHHLMAVALWLFGPVRDVFARVETTRLPSGREVDAPASVLWRHVDPPVHGIWDVTAAPRMRVRTDYYASHEQFEIQGETGIIHVHRASDRLFDEPVLTVYCDGEVRAFHNLDSDWGVSFRLATEHFVRFLLGQEDRAILTPEEGRQVLEFAHLVLRSSREERPLSPPL